MKINKGFRAGTLLFLLLLGFACGQHRDTALHAGFTTQGATLLDASGNPFVLRGINVPHAWHPVRSFDALKEIAGHNINCIRIVWESHLPVKELETIVKKCIQLHMIPMVELHDATGSPSDSTLQELTRYFTTDEAKALYRKYGSYLLVNIANEWGDNHTPGEYWRDAYKKSISMLRNAGYTSTLVIDAPGWGQNSTPVLQYGNELMEFDPAHNLLFSVHMYRSWNEEEKIRNDLEKAVEKALPVIVGEFGYNYQNGNNNLSCKVNPEAVMQVCHELNIGYLAWSWTGNNSENQWLDMVENTDWKTPTLWGKTVLNSPYGITKTAKTARIFNP